MSLQKAASMLIGTGLGLAIWNGLYLLAYWIAERKGKDFSPNLIPLIGPLASLTALALGYRPAWVPLLVALGDVTNFFLIRSGIDEWKTSRWTRIALLQGCDDIREVRLSLHRKGHFLLDSKWHRPSGEMGIVGSGEVGTYVSTPAGYLLAVNPGRAIELRRADDGYRVMDPKGDLDGWELTENAKA